LESAVQPFETFSGVMLPLARVNIDTDAIIPQRWLVTVTRDGLGEGLLGAWRYDEHGRPDPDFVLNLPAYQGARVIVAGANYGCGSSREHAVWAHLDYGIRAVIAPSFGPIFQENSLLNGLLPVELPSDTVASLIEHAQLQPGASCTVDLERCEVTTPDRARHRFHLAEGRRRALLDGTDEIGRTAAMEAQLARFQASQRDMMPWLG
jgi:3-isopropylmalate/(R)-2-methylmalate dehydratase small subunit